MKKIRKNFLHYKKKWFILHFSVPPAAPLVLASSPSSHNIQVQWKQGDTGGAPVTSYTLAFKKEHGAWVQIEVHRHAMSYALNVSALLWACFLVIDVPFAKLS